MTKENHERQSSTAIPSHFLLPKSIPTPLSRTFSRGFRHPRREETHVPWPDQRLLRCAHFAAQSSCPRSPATTATTPTTPHGSSAFRCTPWRSTGMVRPRPTISCISGDPLSCSTTAPDPPYLDVSSGRHIALWFAIYRTSRADRSPAAAQRNSTHSLFRLAHRCRFRRSCDSSGALRLRCGAMEW